MKRTKSKKKIKKKIKKKSIRLSKKIIIIIAVIVCALIALVLSIYLYRLYKPHDTPSANNMDSVSVLITNNGSYTWDEITISASYGMTWYEGDELRSAPAREAVTFSSNREIGTVIELTPEEGGVFDIISDDKGDSYPGIIRLSYTPSGLKVTNLVSLEDYVRGVIASEMPLTFGYEALRAQAVCARSYVVYRRDTYADMDTLSTVDDSVSYQVYGSKWASLDALRAVNDTAGLILIDRDGSVANAMFYSTSMGYSQTQKSDEFPYLGRRYISLSGSDPLRDAGMPTGDEIIDTNKDFEDIFASYIMSSDREALENGEPYFRWEAIIDRAALDRGTNLRSIEILKRTTGGVITSIGMVFDSSYDIIGGELEIRKKLGAAAGTVRLSDGTTREITALPSAAFTLVAEGSGYHIYGGGFGHGCGMSQYGAKALAGAGKNYIEILEFFYKDCTVGQITEG